VPLAALLCKAHLTKPSCNSPLFVKILDVPGTLPWSTLPSHAKALLDLDVHGWEQALTLGRIHRVAGRWYQQLDEAGLLPEVPAAVRDHLWSEHLCAEERQRMARWEVDRIAHAFRASDMPVVLLKGAAYIAAGLPPGAGRLLSDIDILVPFARLTEAEECLRQHGWKTQPHSAYDEHYYRAWMHELPPMQHLARGSVVDVHHTLLPRTDRLSPDPAPLLAAAEPLPGSRLSILAPTDMVLHSIVHGFHGGELANAWRDVLDVHELIEHFAITRADFWPMFEARMRQFGFERPTWYALRLAQQVHGTRIPETFLTRLARHAPTLPPRTVMHWALTRAVLPAMPPTLAERLALRLLYLRSHWVKMPLPLLARHLWTKYRQGNKH